MLGGFLVSLPKQQTCLIYTVSILHSKYYNHMFSKTRHTYIIYIYIYIDTNINYSSTKYI